MCVGSLFSVLIVATELLVAVCANGDYISLTTSILWIYQKRHKSSHKGHELLKTNEMPRFLSLSFASAWQGFDSLMM